MKKSCALVIFVKTPELSPIKTRLAATVGLQNALEFYNLSVLATAAVARKLHAKDAALDLYWAVAESEGINSKRWEEFNRIYQGDGDLGDRLHTVYNKLIQDYNLVAFIGSDSPHVPYKAFQIALMKSRSISDTQFCIGEAVDGGFYFFSGSIPIPKNSWLNVQYSSNQTSMQLINEIEKLGKIWQIEKNFDIDTVKDLRLLSDICCKNLLPEQIALIQWAQNYFKNSRT